MKTNRDVLKLMLKRIKRKNKFCHGLCSAIYQLRTRGAISQDEYSNMQTYLYYNRNGLVAKNSCNDFWWDTGKRKPRIKWLKKHIKNLKQN